ncbi:MAG: TIGR02594 family protein [Rhizobiaceae bacterium]
MPLKYIVTPPEGAFLVSLYHEKDESKPTDALLPDGDVVEIEPENDGNDQDWVFVHREADATTKGWIPMRLLREPAPGDMVRFPLVVKPFVRSCGRAELATIPVDGESGMTVLADFLLAWAWIESATDNELFSNPEADLQGTDAEGPFRLSTADWDAYKAAAGDTGVAISNFERLIPNAQVSGAAHKALADAKQFSELATPVNEPVDGPVVPSYLNVLHCHFMTAGAAHHIQKLKLDNSGAKPLDEALDGVLSAAERDAFFANYGRFAKKDGDAVTIDMFFELTSQALADGFKKVLPAIREHADFLLPPPNTFDGSAPWMEIAKREMKIWEDEGLNEESGDGLKKVIEYFKAVKLDTDKNLPWCGAFVGYCLQESDPSFKQTIVKGGARAANWINWGNINMRQFDLRDIPSGAIVVTHPMFNGTSGHVGFASGKVSGTDKIVVLGGNQGDKVSLRHIHKNRIRHIRWHNALATKPGENIGSNTDPKLQELLGLIASKESHGNYNAHFGKANNQNNPKFTTMTIAQVRKWQDDFVAGGKASSAVGKYQIIRKTLDAIKERMGLNGSETFDENMQDRMAIDLLKVRKLDNFLAGAIDTTKFGNFLAMEWASFPVLSRIKNTKGRFVNRGQSFYAGDGLNKAHVTPEQVEAALDKLR